MVWSASAKSQRGLIEFIEVYIDKRSKFVIVYLSYCLGGLTEKELS
jgi:uncharacterized protein YlbG (UPF0298 family)